MANVASPQNGVSIGAIHGARTAYERHADENQPLGPASSITSNPRSTNGWRSPLLAKPSGKDPVTSTDDYRRKQVNGNAVDHRDEDIPENMYRPDRDDPEGWIHRDKLAKIESEELQAAGINFSNARSRSQSRSKDGQDASSERYGKKDDTRRRLQSPAEIEEEVAHGHWDLRLPEEIEEDTSALQIYTNPVLRKSGSKIPVLTSSPNPIPPERYEREVPIARKRAASGTISLEGDLSVAKTRTAGSSKAADDSDTHSSAVASSGTGSPTKVRSKSATLAAPPAATNTAKKTASTTRKTSVPTRTTPTPGQRPSTRSGEQERPRTAVNRPEGDPPWLATMYKPDPRLPPDQQLIPTLAKKQMQAQWAEEGAIPKTYDRQFAPIAVHTNEDLAKNEIQRERSKSPAAKLDMEVEKQTEPDTWPLKPLGITRSNTIGRPGTPGSVHGGYSPMPKVTSPRIRDGSPSMGISIIPPLAGRSTTAPPSTRMQAQNLAQDDDEKAKKGCSCCVIM